MERLLSTIQLTRTRHAFKYPMRFSCLLIFLINVRFVFSLTSGPAPAPAPVPAYVLPNYCPEILNPSNGSLNISGSRSLNDSALFLCQNGFELSRGAISIGNDTVELTCLVLNDSAGQWSDTSPECTLSNNYCPTLTAPSNGSLSAANLTRLGDSVSHTCARGFGLSQGGSWLNVAELRTHCVVDNGTHGLWNESQIKCESEF
eukprot:19233_1